MIWFTVDLPPTTAPTFAVTLPMVRAATLDDRIRDELPGDASAIAKRLGVPRSTVWWRLCHMRGVEQTRVGRRVVWGPR